MYPILFVAWIGLGVAGFFLFFVNKNLQFKKTYFPIYIILVGALFIAFSMGLGMRPNALYIVVPFVVLISFLNIESTKFCDTCGGTIINQIWFGKLDHCPKCGASLH